MASGIMFEGLIFGGAAVAWGVWELLSLRRANRRAAEKNKNRPGAAADALMAHQSLAVIGGGAKAAALAAKAHCLRETGRADIAVTIFERAAIGSHWDGRHGYTDGRQALCTRAERDLGFPYDRASYGDEVAGLMQSTFSWMSYCVGGNGADDQADWVDRGCSPPSHAAFAAYLRWAVKISGAAVNFGTVTTLTPRAGRWLIGTSPLQAGGRQSFGPFDGLVVTGPGPPASWFPKIEDERVFDGLQFWTSLASVKAFAEAAEDAVVVIGGGGTAAAVAGWLGRNVSLDRPIIIVADQAALHARSNSFFENRAFSDEEIWMSITPEERIAFSDRVNRGVVWENVVDVLTKAPNIIFRPGRVLGVIRDSTGQLIVEYRTANRERPVLLPASLIVDGSGFDGWWFQKLLPAALTGDWDRQTLTSNMDGDLCLPLSGWPRLHLPMKSQSQGPGFGSLMVLGAMSDRILRPYVVASQA